MKKFKKVYIEITNVCNLNCRFCPVTKRAPAFITTNQFQHILDQVKDYTDYIYLHIKGEPLLHPELGQLLDLAHKNKLKTNITTNGTLLKEKKQILLNKDGL